MTLPTDAAERKALPIFSGFIKYFPDAMIAVAELSRIGNEQHNPGKPLFWDRSKSGDELDALTRHLVEAGTIDTDGIRHSAKVAWRAMANLQKEIERDRAKGDEIVVEMESDFPPDLWTLIAREMGRTTAERIDAEILADLKDEPAEAPDWTRSLPVYEACTYPACRAGVCPCVNRGQQRNLRHNQ